MHYQYTLPDGEVGTVNAESPDHARDQIYWMTGVKGDKVKLELPVRQNRESEKQREADRSWEGAVDSQSGAFKP